MAETNGVLAAIIGFASEAIDPFVDGANLSKETKEWLACAYFVGKLRGVDAINSFLGETDIDDAILKEFFEFFEEQVGNEAGDPIPVIPVYSEPAGEAPEGEGPGETENG